MACFSLFVKFDCPYCQSVNVEVPFPEVDFNTDKLADGAWTTCPICGRDVELDEYYDYE